MSTLASIYLASLSNAYRHTYRARISDLTVTVNIHRLVMIY